MFVFISYLFDMDVMEFILYYSARNVNYYFLNFLRVVPWNGKWYDLGN